MAGVSLRGITKRFGKVVAVDNLTLDIDDGEFVVLVGPSGCGKTTALRIVAGLEELTAGEVAIGDKIVNNVPPKDRDIAMVFQSYALYPHMNVRENMSFGLKVRMLKSFFWQLANRGKARDVRAEIERRVQETAKLLGLEHLLERRPSELSGGQRQRVALGRAIVREPKVFLMDEPLSNLDAKLRVQTRAELIRLHRRLGITTIYVTHDQTEAMTMGDRIAVMKDGVLQQYDTPDAVYRHPANTFVASFIGMPPMNLLEVETSSGFAMLGDNSIELPKQVQNGKVTVGIRPEALRPSEGDLRLSFQVDVVEPLGATKTVYLRIGDQQFVGTLDSDVATPEGEQIQLFVRKSDIHLFDSESGRSLRQGA